MRWLVIAITLGCSSAKQPEPLVNRGSASVPSTPMEPQRLELTEGTPVALADGTQVDVKGVGYAHMTESRNLSNATLLVTRDGKTVEVGLAREHGGSADKAPSGDALGWRFTLEMADPYHQPSRAYVNAQKI